MNARKLATPALGVLGLTAVAGLAVWSGPSSVTARIDTYANLPGQVILAGSVRDVKPGSESGGVADFQRQPTAGFAVTPSVAIAYAMVAAFLYGMSRQSLGLSVPAPKPAAAPAE